MSRINQITFDGNVGKDLEIKTFNDSDGCYVDVSVAQQVGKKEDKPVWHLCRFRGKIQTEEGKKSFPEIIADTIKKGDPVVVSGRIAQYTAKNDEGVERQVQYIEGNSIIKGHKFERPEDLPPF